MKKIISMVLTLALFFVAVCFAEGQTFSGTAPGFGGDVSVTVSVEDGTITSVDIVGDGETPDVGGKAIGQFPDIILKAQTNEVESISGATITSNAVKQALKQALTEAGILEAGSGSMTAGTYTYTNRGYCSEITVETTLTESEIAEVKVVDQDETVGIGSYALERIPKAIVENQTAGVDIVTSATASSNAILASVRSALDEAGADMSKFNRHPDPVPAVDEEYTTDVVVVGAGAAGFAAAARALQEGAKVIVVEKMDIPGGNTVRSSGAWFEVPENEIEEYIEYTMEGGHILNDPDLVRVMVTNSSKISPWLRELGFEMDENGEVVGMARGLITSYLNATERLGGEVLFATKAKEIIMENGHAAGIRCTSSNGGNVTIHAKAVVIATGGFGYDLEKCYELKPALKGMITNNQVGATGDGIYMAEAVGAALVDMEQIQAHPTVEQSTATLISEGVRGAGGILVNINGQRFCEETGFRDVVAGHILEQPESYAYLIFNDEVFKDNDNILIYDKVGVVKHCPDYAAIADYIGCELSAIEETMAARNAEYAEKEGVAEQEEEDEFASKTFNITASGPWYVIKVAPGIHHTMGGIKINTNTEVISTTGDIIPGLYAAGEVTGGVHGGNRIGGNALMDCQVFGIIAGEQAAAFAK